MSPYRLVYGKACAVSRRETNQVLYREVGRNEAEMVNLRIGTLCCSKSIQGMGTLSDLVRVHPIHGPSSVEFHQ
jgi:hypothetical protein